MIRQSLITTTVSLGLALAFSTPAQATWWFGGGCKHKCSSSTSSSGGTTTTTGGTTTGGTTTSTGGSTGGSTQVPEPGMLGLMGAGVVGLVIARRRKGKKA